MGLLATGLLITSAWADPAEAARPHPPIPHSSSPLAALLKTVEAPWLHLVPLGSTDTEQPLDALVFGDSARPTRAARQSKLVVLVTPGLDRSGHAVRAFAARLIQHWLQTPALARRQLMQQVLLVLFLGRGFRPWPAPRDPAFQGLDLIPPSNAHSQNLLWAQTATTQAWLRLFDEWHPAWVTEMVTDRSAAWRGSTLFGGTPTDLLAPSVAQQAEAILSDARMAWHHSHIRVGNWIQLRHPGNPSLGVETVSASPAHIVGYTALTDVPAVQWLWHPATGSSPSIRQITRMGMEWIQVLAHQAGALLKAEDQVARESRTDYSQYRKAFSVNNKLARSPGGYLLKTYAYSETLSPISGTVWVRYERDHPRNYLVPRYGRLTGHDPLPNIAGYVIPAGFPRVLHILRAQGIRMDTLATAATLTVHVDRLRHLRWDLDRDQSRMRIRSFKVVPQHRSFVFPPGSVFVPIQQPDARLVVLLLDIRSRLSLFRQGYFNRIFQPVHTDHQTALEVLARTLLRTHPHLARRFLDRIRHPAFAGSPAARLDFFYRYVFHDPISPDLYPIGALQHTPVDTVLTR